MTKPIPKKVKSAQAKGLRGSVRVPGDKSISHRALMIGGLAVGKTSIEGMLEGEDVLNTANAMRLLGASIDRYSADNGSAIWTVCGRGVGGLIEPDSVLDMGNSGTGARLLTGLLASHAITAVITGDESLRQRPMNRVTGPLSSMGASFQSREGGLLPMLVKGMGDPIPLTYKVPVASAQVKSAILLAGLHARGETAVIEPLATRDHTERMLRYFGAAVKTESVNESPNAQKVTIKGLPELMGKPIVVPGDPSSAAFLIVAALITEGSDLILERVGLNPFRTGLLSTLKEMGADLRISNAGEDTGEPIGDIQVRYSELCGVDVPAARAPSMIDEYPILAMAAACAKGITRMEGLGELRVKESDRFEAIVSGLSACGVRTEANGDSIIVEGCAGLVPGGAMIPVQLDHRIAMAFLVLGAAAQSPIGVDDASVISTSYPAFLDHITNLGANLSGYTQMEEG